MDMVLKRYEYADWGIFSILYDDQGNEFARCLEHAYLLPDSVSTFVPKVKSGIYRCIRHRPVRLDYETFMLENVPDFMEKPVSGILIHRGNFNKDSDGCILIGETIVDEWNGFKMLLHSKVTFNRFMNLQHGLDTFNLTIKDS